MLKMNILIYMQLTQRFCVFIITPLSLALSLTTLIRIKFSTRFGNTGNEARQSEHFAQKHFRGTYVHTGSHIMVSYVAYMQWRS